MLSQSGIAAAALRGGEGVKEGVAAAAYGARGAATWSLCGCTAAARLHWPRGRSSPQSSMAFLLLHVLSCGGSGRERRRYGAVFRRGKRHRPWVQQLFEPSRAAQ